MGRLTRREFLKVAGTGVAGASLLGVSQCGPPDKAGKAPGGANKAQTTTSTKPEKAVNQDRRPNVVLVIVDTLRKDHIGAYGNDWIHTPTLDALAKESFRFTRAYPESMPTILARRAIHTGLRAWPFRNWHRYKGIDVGLYGWEPIPEDQTTLAETLQASGYNTMFVTDNLQQYDPSMDFQRGFDAYEFIRGQNTDKYQPTSLAPREKLDQTLIRYDVHGTGGLGFFEQYFANTTYRKTEEDWFSPQVFTKAMEYLENAKNGGQPFFLTVDAYDPHAPWDPPEEYVSLYDQGLQRTGALRGGLWSRKLPHREAAKAGARSLRR